MSDRNASASAFGWDFQVNAVILLMLENIKEAKCVRVEGADEDIEITFQDEKKLYAQAKAVEKPDDTSHVIDKLAKALETLSEAAKNGDGKIFTYITNSSNPFNSQRTLSYFMGRTHLYYDELPDIAKEKIKKIIKSKNYLGLDVNKIDVRVIPFYGRDLKNRYKEIQSCINEFFNYINIDAHGIDLEIMKIWQLDLFQNATQADTTISVTKGKMIWPLIVLVVDKTAANEYKKDFDDEEIGEIECKYKMIINQKTMSCDLITRVLSDFRNAKKQQKQFVADCWREYLDLLDTIKVDDSIKESLIKIVIYRILTQRNCLRHIKSGVNL